MTARVFWDPAVCPHTLPLAAPDGSGRRRALLRVLDHVTCQRVVLHTADGAHVLFFEQGRPLQLFFRTMGSYDSFGLVTDAVVRPKDLAIRLRSLACFNELLVLGRILPRHFRPDPRGRRLSTALQALDGDQSGATHREIAVALYGRRFVDADWADPRENLRDMVRRAIRRGRAIMSGGYLQLLQ